ncbi:hypothetical protein [Halalkalicoccus subterraneus]|uniref:hypothetical protein n=1 Tax=Halalkalicoccus subterraneus TaxID=2675002 RepID=UPI0013CF0EB7|nr:hypothetical protein [Halalkalicoccus subterraneus]
MALTVNTLAEVPKGKGYIVEVGLERNTEHPANKIDRDQIRNELGVGEWYVRTGDKREEKQLIFDIDNIDHARLPAYVVLTSNPSQATEGVAIHLNEVKSEEEAWWILQTAIEVLRESMNADNGEFDFAEKMKKRFIATERPLSITASAITVIEFSMGIIG